MKAQIHAGGRGKGGGVKVARCSTGAGRCLGRYWVCGSSPTRPGPGPAGAALLIEKASNRQGVLHRSGGGSRYAAVGLMASSEGGMDIEEVAQEQAGKDPQGLHRSDRRANRRAGADVPRKIGVPATAVAAGVVLQKLYRLTTRPTPRWPKSIR